MGWISVKDQLPGECVAVLIYSKGFDPASAYLIYVRGSHVCWQINDWDEGDPIYPWNKPSHWMPMPELPNDE